MLISLTLIINSGTFPNYAILGVIRGDIVKKLKCPNCGKATIRLWEKAFLAFRQTTRRCKECNGIYGLGWREVILQIASVPFYCYAWETMPDMDGKVYALILVLILERVLNILFVPVVTVRADADRLFKCPHCGEKTITLWERANLGVRSMSNKCKRCDGSYLASDWHEFILTIATAFGIYYVMVNISGIIFKSLLCMLVVTLYMAAKIFLIPVVKK
jgi:predicted RNA-binding Zn-ribbon protein involved in translation (DUF1610 family)